VHHEVLPDRFKGPDAVAAGVFFAAQLVRPEVVAFIAERDGEAVGYALAEELRRRARSRSLGRRCTCTTWLSSTLCVTGVSAAC